MIYTVGSIALLPLTRRNNHGVTIACNGAGGRVGFEINASRAGPLMRDVRLRIAESIHMDMHHDWA